MKVIKVSIQDEHTLMLQEAGEKGDVIDLRSLHETDIDKTSIESVVRSIKKDKFDKELAKALAGVSLDEPADNPTPDPAPTNTFGAPATESVLPPVAPAPEAPARPRHARRRLSTAPVGLRQEGQPRSGANGNHHWLEGFGEGT